MDFENVCDIDTTILGNTNVMLVLLVGAGRTTRDLTLVDPLVEHLQNKYLLVSQKTQPAP